MSGGGFEYVAFISLFFILVWFAGRLMSLLHISPLLGQIVVGVLLGPNGPKIFHFVPYTTELIGVHGEHGLDDLYEEISHHPELVHTLPSILDLVGRIGVILMIFESGLHIDFEVLKEVGPRASLVAILGTILPIICGTGVMLGMGQGFLPAIATGVALAPTSVGIALNLLSEQKQLDSVFGQTIVTAAFVDDVLSLIALVVLISFSKGDLNAWAVCKPVLGSIFFVGAGGLVALYAAPPGWKWMMEKIKRNPKPSLGPRDEVLLIWMFLTLCMDAYIAEFIGSHLLGAFVAGVTFSKVPRAMMVWKRQVKRIVYWMVRLFFCATVAFSIPIQVMFNLRSLAFGCLLGFAGCITKVVAGVVLKEDRILVGTAMVPRGEFAYLIAQRCYSDLIIDKETYSVLVWALVIATVIAPFVFSFVLKRKLSKRELSEYSGFQIQISGHHHTGVLREICEILHNEAFDVIQARMESDGQVDVEIFVVAPRGGTNVDIDPATLAHFKHHLAEALDDENAQVEVSPLTRNDLDDIEGKIPTDTASQNQRDSKIASSGILIKLMVEHQKNIFAIITQKLDEMDLTVKSANVEDFGGTLDVDEFYVEKKDGGKMDQMTRERIRDQMTTVFKENEVKGEIMVRFVAKEPESFQTARHNLMREVTNLHADAYHIQMKNPDAPLDKIIKQLNDRGLEVLSCKKNKVGNEEHLDLVVVDEKRHSSVEEVPPEKKLKPRLSNRSKSARTLTQRSKSARNLSHSKKKHSNKSARNLGTGVDPRIGALRNQKNRSKEITGSLRNVLASSSTFTVGKVDQSADGDGTICEMREITESLVDRQMRSSTQPIDEKESNDSRPSEDANGSRPSEDAMLKNVSSSPNLVSSKSHHEKLVLQFHGHTGHASPEDLRRRAVTTPINPAMKEGRTLIQDAPVEVHRVKSIHQMKFINGKFTTDRIHGKRKRRETTGKEDPQQNFV